MRWHWALVPETIVLSRDNTLNTWQYTEWIDYIAYSESFS